MYVYIRVYIYMYMCVCIYICYSKKTLVISEPGSAASGTSSFKAPGSSEVAELVHSPEKIGGTGPKASRRLGTMSHILGVGFAHLVKINSFCISSFL